MPTTMPRITISAMTPNAIFNNINGTFCFFSPGSSGVAVGVKTAIVGSGGSGVVEMGTLIVGAGASGLCDSTVGTESGATRPVLLITSVLFGSAAKDKSVPSERQKLYSSAYVRPHCGHDRIAVVVRAL